MVRTIHGESSMDTLDGANSDELSRQLDCQRHAAGGKSNIQGLIYGTNFHCTVSFLL